MKTKPTLLLLAFLMFGNFLYSQTVVCGNASCTANDYTLDYFYLGDADGVAFGPGYCEPGSVVNAHIWSNFTANAAAPRYSLYLHFNLYVDGVYINTVDECYYENQSVPTNIELDLLNFDWNCGSEITLEDFYMSWQPNANKDCGCNGAKCYKETSILVRAPLIANYDFFPSCETAYTLDFTSTTTGGIPPYSYLWDFGDGSTSTLANPTHTYTSTGPYTVTLTVVDQENTDSYEQLLVNFPANLPPEIYAPTNRNLEGCTVDDLPDLPFSTTPVNITEAQLNNAGGSVVISNELVSITYLDSVTGTCPTTVIRTFTVYDSCDNTDTDIQVFEIDDTSSPQASNPPTITVACADDVPNPNPNVVTNVNDGCGTTTVNFVSDVSNNNTCPETILRTYSITDSCGNTSQVVQTIIINDDVAPTASNPPTINVECTGTIPPPDVNVVTTEADNCSTPTVTFVSDTPQSESCPITILRTYRVEDECGNSITVTQNIIISDTTPPTATGPADITVQCDSEIPDPDINQITNVTDNCSTPVVAFVSDVTNAGSCPEVITRTYSVTDECGNETLISQDITIVDDTSPNATAPPDINVQCVDDIPPPDISVISDVTDNCGVPVVSFISDVSTGQCPQIITRTYRVEDSCGNSIDLIQNINVTDDTPPTASNPEPIYANCSDGIPPVDPSVVTDEADNCSVPTVTFVSDTSDGACPETITRVYRVRDLCGNFILVSQQIIITDDTPPTLVGSLDDESVSCTAIPEPSNPTFTDDCDSDLTVDFVETDTNNNNTVDYVITRTWTVTDRCGNVATFTKLINVDIEDCIVSVCNSCGTEDDIIPPTASNPPDLNVQCGSDIPPPNPEVVTDEADNCVPPVVAFVSEDVSVDCTEKVVRTYSVTDECGNVIYVTHRINVVDDVSPFATNPQPVNLACNEDIPPPDVTVVTDATDNCSNVTIRFVSDVANESCEGRVTRTYRVSDVCGNFIDVYQEFNIIDDIAPTATGPANINVSCIENIPIPNPNVVTNISDNCSTPVVTFVSDISDDNICPETITRTYRVTDDCGNYTDIEQLIIVQDDIAPTASNPAPLQFTCIADLPAPNISVVTDEADNCFTPIVEFVGDVSDNQTCPETITRTYRVSDVCGNFIEVFQTITITDDIPPTGSNAETTNVQTLNDVSEPNPEVIIDEADNCGIPTVAFVSESSDGAECPETITRIYSITDDCGNSIEVQHQIIVGNFVNPTVTTPEPVSVQCPEEVPPVDTSIISAQSSDGSEITVTFISEVSNNQSCPEVITRTYRATDECGNSTDAFHTIIIDDDTPPTASNPPSITLYDIADVPPVDIEVVIDEADNCGIPTVAFVSEQSNNDGCEEIISRTYSVTDACGNSINVVHDIIIIDIEPPTASPPADLVLSCEEPIPAPDPSIITDATDRSNPINIYYVSETSNQETCPEIITRIYRVLDACGNFIELEHRIIIDDEIFPTASNPEPTSVIGVENIPDPDPEVVIDEADNCDIPTVEFVSESSNNDPCEEIITRIYSVTDACDNQITVTHVINVTVDNEPPTVTAPAADSYNCIEEVPAPDPSIINATDNLSVVTVTFVNESSTQDKCGEQIIRIYNVSDECGNNIDVEHIINIQDTVAPELVTDFEREITLVCEVDPETPTLEFTDNCSSSLDVLYDETYVDIDEYGYDIIRTWTALDNCDNATEVIQKVHMVNTVSSVSREVDLCIGEPALDLMNFVENEGGTWSGPYLSLLENETFFDATFVPLGTYYFTYTWVSNTCSTVTDIIVNVNDDCINYPCIKSIADVDISKMVTPNSDGYNDFLEVGYVLNGQAKSSCNIQIVLQIFNRWGTKVYEDRNYQNNWDGSSPSSSLGSAGKLPTGAYYYIVDLINSGLDPIQGYIHLGTQ